MREPNIQPQQRNATTWVSTSRSSFTSVGAARSTSPPHGTAASLTKNKPFFENSPTVVHQVVLPQPVLVPVRVPKVRVRVGLGGRGRGTGKGPDLGEGLACCSSNTSQDSPLHRPNKRRPTHSSRRRVKQRHSQAEPVVVDVREPDVSPHVHAVENLRVRPVRAVTTHLKFQVRAVSVNNGARLRERQAVYYERAGMQHHPICRVLAEDDAQHQFVRQRTCAPRYQEKRIYLLLDLAEVCRGGTSLFQSLK